MLQRKWEGGRERERERIHATDIHYTIIIHLDCFNRETFRSGTKQENTEFQHETLYGDPDVNEHTHTHM